MLCNIDWLASFPSHSNDSLLQLNMNPSERTHLHLKQFTENWRHSHILQTVSSAWCRYMAWKLFVGHPGPALLTHICICNTSPIWLRVSTVRCRDIAWRLFVGHPGPALWPFCKLCTGLMVEVRFPSWDREAFLNFAQLDFFSSGQRRAFYTELYFTIQSGRNQISLVIWRLQRQSNTLDYEHQKCFEDF